MRKTTHLALVAGLVASAFASTGAQRATACENADGDEVISTADEGYEGTISGQSLAFMGTGFRTVNYFQVDTSTAKADVVFTITASGAGQYDLGIEDADENEVGSATMSEGVATFTAKKFADCTSIVVFVYAEQSGGPTSPLVDVTFTAVEDD